MQTFDVQMVGQPAQPVQRIEAHSPFHAVEQIAGCFWEDICLPIWRRGPDWRRTGYWETECYMPRDGTGRQWLVTLVSL